MYLPHDIPHARVLVTVKTYPLPSSKYEELVCTAGILPNGQWIRIYPISFRSRPYQEQYKKYSWVELNLVRNTKDFRPESYRPKLGADEPINTTDSIDTSSGWAKRKDIILQEVFTSMSKLVELAKSSEQKSLATLKPVEIIDFVIEETDREWKQEWRDHLLQFNIFDLNSKGEGTKREIVRKLPYKYSYKFLTEGDKKPRQIMIEDWEIGALYWNCLARAEGDERIANQQVRQKYFDTFVENKDLYLFLGTTLKYHNVAPNPFVIIGVFYPPKNYKPPKDEIPQQLTLF